MTESFRIEGMHCASCTAKVTAALESVAGIKKADVTLSPPQAIVDMDPSVSFSDLNDSLAKVGPYRVAELLDTKSTGIAAPVTSESPPASVYPLVLILTYLAGTVALIGWTTGELSAHTLMRWFMGAFFLAFSFFKLLDLHGFVNAYRSYDVLARASPIWGYAYPFVELALGAGYVMDWNLRVLNVFTLVLMALGSIGVLGALLRRRAIQCACLGTALKLPMTKVTLLEDLGMAGMAAAMLAISQ